MGEPSPTTGVGRRTGLRDRVTVVCGYRNSMPKELRTKTDVAESTRLPYRQAGVPGRRTEEPDLEATLRHRVLALTK